MSELDLSLIDEMRTDESDTASFQTSKAQNVEKLEVAAGYLGDIETSTEDESSYPVLPLHSSNDFKDATNTSTNASTNDGRMPSA